MLLFSISIAVSLIIYHCLSLLRAKRHQYGTICEDNRRRDMSVTLIWNGAMIGMRYQPLYHCAVV